MNRRGSSFIEVLLALVLLVIAGTALVTLLGQTAHSIKSLEATEIQTRAAARELGALSVLSRADLAARVGRTRPHGWSMQVNRTAPDLFEVAIAESDTGMTLLRTVLYRPDTVNNGSP